MKSLAVHEDGRLEVIDIDVPQPGKYGALVKILASGICGTDMKIIHGRLKGFSAYPGLLGHEAVGEVVEVGGAVTRFKPGDRVLLPYLHGKVNGYTPIHGGFSEYGIVHDWQAMKKDGMGPGTPDFNDFFYTQKVIPKSFDPVSSVMIVTLREVLAATRQFGFRANQNIVIFGGGPVGLAFTKFAQILGMGPIILVDVLDEKREEALNAGADYFINSKKQDLVEVVRDICPGGTDYTLDAVGVSSLMNLCMKLIKSGGRILIYGISPQNHVELNWDAAPFNWSIECFQEPIKWNEGDVHEQLIRWIEMGMVDPSDFISHVIDKENILDGFEILEKKQPAKKIVIKY